MAFSYACLILQRVVIPTVLVLSALFRPVGISFVYMLMFFLTPFIPIATSRNFKASVTPFLIILIALNTILILCHIALQVTIATLNITDAFGSCSFTEQLLRNIGFVDFRNLKYLAVIEWLAPEVVVFITALTCYFVIKKLTTLPVPGPAEAESGEVTAQQIRNDTEAGATAVVATPSALNITPSKRIDESEEPNFDALIRISPFFCLAALFFAAVLRPSVPGGYYFLMFLLWGTYWATFQTLKRVFALLLRLIMVVLVVHTLCIVAYQTPWLQQHLDSHSLVARLIGLEPLIKSTCANDIRIIVYDTSFKLDSYLNPIMLAFAYFVLALTTKTLINPRIVEKPATAFGQQLENGSNNKFNRQISLMAPTTRGSSKKESWTKSQRLNVSLRRERRSIKTEPTETTPLVRHATRKTRTISTTESHDIPLESREAREEDSGTASFIEQIVYGIISVGGFIYQNSYIFTNILMMTWSIIYHSWLTFVLLLWANVLWMIPNQRKAMMRSSPFIVLYAELLLLAQYIYGMDLTNDELPSSVGTPGINLEQIGLDRPQENGTQPCVPLIVKTAFLLMFWVTLRQLFKEKHDKYPGPDGGITAPLQTRGDELHFASNQTDGKKTSKFLKKAGDIIKNLLVRLWIWLLVLVIFLCAITGTKMTGFRICYMALFLFFLLVFQSSSKAWVKVMYGFWLFLIFYAMSILILIYTYQFDKFEKYWEDYLNISETLQKDIGLKRYEIKDLFLKLVSPTIIVILTVIQVHYFHKRFIASLLQQQQQAQQQPQQQPPAAVEWKQSAPSLTSLSTHPRKTSQAAPLNSETIGFEQSAFNLIRIFLKKVKINTKKFLRNFKDVFWRFLELHIIKAVYIMAFVCCISEVCVLHIVFVGLTLLGAVSRSKIKTFISRLISFIVTIIILSKMIYQIGYLDHDRYNVTCPNSNITQNNAVWVGLEKANPANGGLMTLLKKYIIYMVMVTLHAVVSLRQYQMRSIYGKENDPQPKVLFPKVGRADAEKNLEGMIKYLFNYGFYKFGLEISLITLVATITYRQDIVAVIYAIWLFVLLCFDRSNLSKICAVFQCFIGILIIIQYLLLVGLPPSLCLSYPWSGSPYSESIQRWAMLPGYLHFNHASKLIFDFILLLMINRQRMVFHIETLHADKEYAGGSNKSVVSDIANLGQVPFDNPTHDFLSHVRNYLDVFKNAILCGFYWITLAVIFLAGTNIADFLALGYLIGAFIFLWQGSDFYLRPINTIIRRWKLFIFYNVANIVIKTCLQMAGCLFMKQLTTNCCWLVHMLGITCASSTTLKRVAEDAINVPDALDVCPATSTHVVLIWDAVCFGFLLFQMRIFKSHYFCHIITDTTANNMLASRGAEIIEDLRQKQFEHRQQHEKEILFKIKRKMEKIRATQQKMLRPIEKPTHFDVVAAQEFVELVAPLAHNSSLSSCQGSGYRTPDDDDDEEANSSTDENEASDECSSTVATPRSTSESAEEHAQLLDGELPMTTQQTRVEGDDVASDVQTDYADVSSSSESDGDNALAEGVKHLQLPEMEVQANTQSHTPSSDMMTLPLDGFLDVNRFSMGSAPNSDLIIRLHEQSSEEPSEVFPPAVDIALQAPTLDTLQLPAVHAPHTSYSLNVNVSGGSSVISSNLTASGAAGVSSVVGGGERHRRQSSINAVSWNETVSIKCTPKEATDSAEVSEDIPVTLRQKSLHRRHLSMGNAAYSMDEQSTLQNGRRRYSNVSWARAETARAAAARPNSWGPVGTAYYLDSLMVDVIDPTLHGQSIRAGDYYMFEDMDDKFELDLIEDEPDFLEHDDKIAESEKKMTRRKTLFDVWKDLHSAEYRRQLYVRQRSYASAPGSRMGIKIDEELDAHDGGIGVRTSTHSEPLDFARRSSSCEYFVQTAKDQHPSTSKEAAAEEISEIKKKPEPESTEITEKDSDEDINANPIVRLLEGFLVSLTMRLNRFSRNYRYVNKILTEEKKALKESDSLHRMGRTGAAAMFNLLRKNYDSNEREDDLNPHNAPSNNTNIPPPNDTNDITTTPTSTTTITNLQSPSLSQDQPQDLHAIDNIIELPLDTVDGKRAGQEGSSTASLVKGFLTIRRRRKHKSEGLPEIYIKAPSFERSHHEASGSAQWTHDKVVSTGEYAFEEEDFTTRDHHIIVEVLIAAWYTLLSNTDLICYIVVFINQVVNSSIISLPLPIMVFLWGTLSLPRPTKTFWVTLIAYTQAVVLIKCIFQYKLIWANYTSFSKPLSPARIFGVELDPDYATYDLLLLLVLFFHRFILKSQGLWKSEYKEEIVTHSLSDEKTSVEGGQNNSEDNNSKALVPTDTRLVEHINSDEQRSIISETELNIMYKERIERLKRAKYFSSLRKFFSNMVRKVRLPADVYALMFLCDFINFFVLGFGISSFGSQQSEDGGVQTYLAENKVPVPFLIMLLVQFVLIVIDRALYLRKALVKKIIFHFCSVIGIHIWMFFVIPAVTERSFYSLAPPIIYYIIKCFYFLLSAYQIKCGYPKRILGNFLTKGFSMINMISFRIYSLIPFLYELRTILDWVCTDSTMTMFDWLKMEDIFSEIYFIKCTRQMETDFPAIRAQKKAIFNKLLMGGVMILFIVFLIWGPLAIFALGNAVGTPNLPYEVSLKIRIGPYDPIYSTSNRESIFKLNESLFEDMQNAYDKNKFALTFLNNYDAEDVAVVRLAGNSPSIWTISPPDKDRFLNDLETNVSLTVRYSYTLTRIAPAEGLFGTVGSEITLKLNESFTGRQAMIDLLKGNSQEELVELPNMIPKFIKVLNSGDPQTVQVLMPHGQMYRPLVIKIHATNTSDFWWEIRDYCNDTFHNTILSKLAYDNCESGIVMYTFNDKKFPSKLSFITGKGILGIYASLVFLASRLFKSFTSGQNRKIMFEDLPYVDRVLQLCLDIYLVREALEFALEEDLFAKLIFLYRSPETMIKWTRPKEEANDDETDTESVRSRNSSRRPEHPQ